MGSAISSTTGATSSWCRRCSAPRCCWGSSGTPATGWCGSWSGACCAGSIRASDEDPRPRPLANVHRSGPRDAGAARRRSRGRRARVRLPARAVGLRQVDAAEHRRRLPASFRRRGASGRAAGHRARRRPRRGVPGVRALSVAHGGRQRPVRPQAEGGAGGGAPRGGGALPRAGGPRLARREVSGPALGRDEAARGHRARARQQSRDHPDGRAVRRPRRADTRGAAGRARPHPARRAQDGALRHALHPRGRLSRRPRGGDDHRAGTDQAGLSDQAARGARPLRARVHPLRERDHPRGEGRGREGARVRRTRILALLGVLAVWPIPPLAFLPMFLVWFGLGEASKVAFIGYTTFFPMFVAVAAAVLRVDVTLLRAAASLGAGHLDLIHRVIVPAALPGIIVALRLGFALALFVIVGAEFMGADAGLGHLIMEGRNFFLPAQIVMGALVLGLLGSIVNALLLAAERRLFRWREAGATS